MRSSPIATIDLLALKHNFQCVKAHAPNSKVMAVIKANAYGHGVIEVANALQESDAFAVARLDEALQLRDGGITQPVVVLEGVFSDSDLVLASSKGISLVFHTFEQVALIEKTILKKALPLCWIMVETGMNRLGFAVTEIHEVHQRLIESGNIEANLGLMSHFANSDLIDDARNPQQLARLQQVASDLNLCTSMANSAAILSYPESHGDWVRPGIMLYGASPFSDVSAKSLDLKPVMKLTANITALKSIKQGEQVGYGGIWTAEQDSRIAIIGIGYADGFSRHLSNVGHVIIQGRLVNVIGRVSMDMIAVDVTQIGDIAIGDEVSIWGDEKLTIDDVAVNANTISYELLCQVNQRVIRDYRNGKN
jgi:alanine racemase